MCEPYFVSGDPALNHLRVLFLEEDPGPFLLQAPFWMRKVPGAGEFLHEREKTPESGAQRLVWKLD